MSKINEYVTAIHLAKGSCVKLQFISLRSSYTLCEHHLAGHRCAF